MESNRDAEVMAQLLVFAEQTTDFVGVSDPWGRVIFLNSAARKRLGVADPTELTTADIFPVEEFTLYHEVVRPQLLQTGAWSGEVRVNVAGGVAVPMYVSVSTRVGPGGETHGIVMYAHELADRRLSARPRVDSMCDEITGLLPRPAFDERVRLALATAARDGDSCAFVLATVVNMDDTIERFDVPGGPAVMRALAGRMTRLARTIDIVGHVDEHQLGILLLGVHTRNEVLRIARMVRESLVEVPIPTPSGDIAALVGCGVAVCEPHDDLASLIARASATTRPEQVAGVDADRRSRRHRSSRRVRDDGRVPRRHESGRRAGLRPTRRRPRFRSRGRLSGTRAVAPSPPRSTRRRGLRRHDLRDRARDAGRSLCRPGNGGGARAHDPRDTPLCLYAPVSKRLIADVRTEQYLLEIAEAFSLTMHQIRLQIARPLLDDWSPALDDALHSLRDTEVRLVLTGVEHASDAQDLDEYGFGELHLSRRLTSDAAHDCRRASGPCRRSFGMHTIAGSSSRPAACTTSDIETCSPKPGATSRPATSTAGPNPPRPSTSNEPVASGKCSNRAVRPWSEAWIATSLAADVRRGSRRGSRRLDVRARRR